MLFEKIERSSLAEDIATKLLSLIKDRKLSPGEKLPSERELAILMEVSRPSLREALRALSLMRIIEIRPGDGTYISSLEPINLLEHLNFVYSLNDYSFLELLEARKIVEVGIAKVAALKISAQQLEELDTCLENSVRNQKAPKVFIEADLRLHEIICEAADNGLLSRFMLSISTLSKASRMRTTEIEGVPARVIQDHQKIIAALRNHDVDAAQNAMQAHLTFIEDQLRKSMQLV